METLKEFKDDNAIHFSAALSFYTIFSLPPVLIIVISISGMIFTKSEVTAKIFQELATLLGTETAQEVQSIVEKANNLKPTLWAKISGISALVISATGIFNSLQDSLNYIWAVKAKPRYSFLKMIFNRVLSFSMLITLAFLLMISLVVHAVVITITTWLSDLFEQNTLFLLQLGNIFLSFSIITLLFGFIYKVLPDVKISWKDVTVGAIATALLFSIGKYFFGLYLGKSNLISTYGAAGAIILVLLWVFYSSIVLFLGAEFTQVYARRNNRDIQPSDFAVRVIREEVDNNSEPKQ